MLIETLITVALTLGVAFAAVMFIQRRRLERSFLKKWGVPKSEGANVLLKVTEGLTNEGKDWDTVELTARPIMNDLWMLEGEQTKALAIVRKMWERHPGNVAYTPESVLRLVGDVRAKIGDVDAPATKAGLDHMEKMAQDAHLNNHPLTREQIVAMRDYFAEIEHRHGEGTV
jgi:hypothetical protein